MVEYTPTEMTNALTIGQTEYPRSIIQIHDNSQIIGDLIIDKKGGMLRFEGNVDQSAQEFFDEIIKKYAEAYL